MYRIALLFAACDAPDPGRAKAPTDETAASSPALAFTATWTPNDLPDAPLGWRLAVDAAGPVSVVVRRIDAAGERVDGPFTGDLSEIWLFGWRAGETTTAVVEATAADGTTATDTQALTAPPRPADLANWEVLVADPAEMSPGPTWFAPTKQGPGAASYLVAIDPDGALVWWYRTTGSIHAFTQLPNGHLRLMRDKDGVYEVDLRGQTVASWHPTGGPSGGVSVATAALHHDVIDGPDGHLIALSVEGRDLDAYPVSEQTPSAFAPAFVAGDVVVEFDPVTGAVVQEWRLLDWLDTTRIGWDGVVGDYWESFFRRDTKDWSHGNALRYDPSQDLIWVSLRHQDALVAIDRTEGVVAILANDWFWSPPAERVRLKMTGDGGYPYHQHGHDFGPDGDLLVFDNGNNRTSPPVEPSGPTTSRAVQYRVDRAAGTVEQVWTYDDPRGLYAGSLGNVQWLADRDHVLVDYGNLARAATTDPGARVLEVTRTDPPRVVFELALHPLDPVLGDVTAYRAFRWPTLQPVPGMP